MKLATIILNLTKEGHQVVRDNVTPAELALLVSLHHTNAGGKPIDMDSKGNFAEGHLIVTGDTGIEVGKDEKGNKTEKKVTPRTPGDEKRRLAQRYAGNVISAIYPGATPNMPSEFKEAYEMGIKTVLPSSKLTESQK